MSTFKDTNGRTWTLPTITFDRTEYIAAETEVVIQNLLLKNLAGLEELLGDYRKVVAVVWCLVEDQAGKLNVTREQFARLLDGQVLEDMADALLQAIADFFRKSKPVLLKLLEKTRQVSDLATKEALDKLDRLDPADVLKRIESGTNSLITGSGKPGN
jgi:hypothetical protein